MIIELEKLKALLWEEWDPIGVNQFASAKDEYDSYAFQLFQMLHAGAGLQDIEAFLKWAEQENMGLNPTGVHSQIAEKVMNIHRNGQ
ncbi:hypothetical protein [Blastomonas sp.]|uniref:hypothetical protein n=1 Tax=Blastomonas sp. TaxID=1909299 RepID=UPI00262269F8|nr:hypothetical protein [Blastomonas sp.]MDM7956318.1 hypothetical protein [Blastomonas sp.]